MWLTLQFKIIGIFKRHRQIFTDKISSFEALNTFNNNKIYVLIAELY